MEFHSIVEVLYHFKANWGEGGLGRGNTERMSMWWESER